MIEAPRIASDELKRLMDAGEDVVVLDMRRASYLESDSRIKGDVRMTREELPEEYTRLPEGARVVTYCT